MSRRVSLPTADDLFRPTVVPDPVQAAPAASEPEPLAADAAGVEASPQPDSAAASAPGTVRVPSGRVKHDEKMTVYITSDELLDIEHARLVLRRNHGLGIDRGRLVRAAVALVLADFEASGEDSALVQRLTAE